MFGFPISNGNSGQTDFIEKFTNNANSGFQNNQQKEVFYSIKDGNWNDITTWQTATGRVGKVPSANDDVFIRNLISLTSVTVFCNNLCVTGILKLSPAAVHVYGNIKSYGTIDLSHASTQSTLYLYGTDNMIKNVIWGTFGLISYAKIGGNQEVLNLLYQNLEVVNAGTKYITSDLTVVRNVTVIRNQPNTNTILDVSAYAVTIGGLLQTADNGSIIRSVECSNIPFTIGSYNVPAGTGASSINLGPNNDLEVVIGGSYVASQTTLTCRRLIFSASATISGNQATSWNCDVYVKSGLTVTLTGSFALTHNGTLIAESSTSAFIITSTGTYNMTQNVPLFSGGSFTNNGSIYYNMNGDRAIEFTSFVDLAIGGTGTKTLSGDTVVTRNLVGARTLELSTYNLTVNNEFRGSNAQIIRTPTNTGKLFKFTTFIAGASGGTVNVGSTNNIEMTGTSFALNQNTFTCNQFIISNNVTAGSQAQSLTIIGQLFIKTGFSFTFNQNTTLTLNGLEGEASTSSFVVTAGTVSYRGAAQPMSVGNLDLSTSLNTFIYSNSDQLIKGGTYRNLTLNGGGTKTLQGNVSVLNTYTLTGPAILNLNGFTLTNP